MTGLELEWFLNCHYSFRCGNRASDRTNCWSIFAKLNIENNHSRNEERAWIAEEARIIYQFDLRNRFRKLNDGKRALNFKILDFHFNHWWLGVSFEIAIALCYTKKVQWNHLCRKRQRSITLKARNSLFSLTYKLVATFSFRVQNFKSSFKNLCYYTYLTQMTKAYRVEKCIWTSYAVFIRFTALGAY